MQSNYFANNQGQNEELHRLNFPPQKAFHLYSFKFTSKMIEWYVDGDLIRTATRNTPKLSNGPFKIFMNMWVAGPKAQAWAGKYYQRKSGVHTLYDVVQYIKGENCKVTKYLQNV